MINIEVICSNKQIHENRVQIRFKTNKNKYPSWQNVLDRYYQNWNQEVITIDSANVDINASFKQLINLLDIK